MDLVMLTTEYQTDDLSAENICSMRTSRLACHQDTWYMVKTYLSQTCFLPASTHDEHEGTAHMVQLHKDRCSINKDSALKVPDVTSIIIIKNILSDSPYGTIDGMQSK